MTMLPYLLCNVARRPVEVHRPDGSVEVLPHGKEVRVEAADPALDRLERLGVLTRHEAPPLPKPMAPRKRRKPAKRAASAKPGKTKSAKPNPETPQAPSRIRRTPDPVVDEPGGSS